MSDKTVKHEIEQIVEDTHKFDLFEGRLLVDRICEAVLKMAEGMPIPRETNLPANYHHIHTLCEGERNYHKKCQDYWRKQVE